ncbi:MAG: hypothetical protein ACJA01_004217 [Saprospiraceae bacterium]|jgi:hypothetical protein
MSYLSEHPLISPEIMILLICTETDDPPHIQGCWRLLRKKQKREDTDE